MQPLCGLAVAATALVVSACTNAVQSVVNNPSEITLDRALKETITALQNARAHADTYRHPDGSRDPIGLNACSVQAVFNVTAGGADRQGLVLNVGAPAGAPVTVGLQGSIEQSATATRGNVVTVLFTSPACNPPNTLGSGRPDQLVTLQRQIDMVRDGSYATTPGTSQRYGRRRGSDWRANFRPARPITPDASTPREDAPTAPARSGGGGGGGGFGRHGPDLAPHTVD